MRNSECIAAVVALATLSLIAGAEIVTPVASYEPGETTLTVTKNAGDVGLSIAIVPGGVSGAPPATDGVNVLKVTITNETDRKVEFRHTWTGPHYDLAGNNVLLADVYIATAGAIPGLMGIWSQNWNPPDAWQIATGIPTTTGTWKTISLDVSAREQTGLTYIWAFIFENLAGTSGVAYVDNLRLVGPGGAPSLVTGVAALGCEGHNAIAWKPLTAPGLAGYNIYRALAETGPFAQLNAGPLPDAEYEDATGPGSPRYYYYVTAVIDGNESAPSEVVSAQWNGLSDEYLLDWVQQETFRYFWDYGHPVSGLAREGLTHGYDICATGGTGMGLMAIVVGTERGFVTRAAAAGRVQQILTFLDTSATRYHGAWSHWINGSTGATIPFSPQDDGGDLVETAYLAAGLLTVRQYFDDPVDPVEVGIRTRATAMWEGIEWDWYRRFPGSEVLYWHWSPNFGWAMNLPIRGYNETMIVYLLAIASPTHPMPASSYANGWAGLPSYANGGTFYGYPLAVGPDYGGPLFFVHYSFLGFDPRYKRDAYCNYYEYGRNVALVHQAYSIDNPGGFAGYCRWLWGLTSSDGPGGYRAHYPFYDDGTISPTAALGSMPFVPDESRAFLRYLLDNYAPAVIGAYGLDDALNPQLGWTSGTQLAIDQGPIVVMIENARSGLLWRLFMANPEIAPMLAAIGMYFEVDYDSDGDVDGADVLTWAACVAGPEVTSPPPPSTPAQFADADLDNDADVDLHDAAVVQQIFTGQVTK